jgi:predicted phage terminase large subunit-like protein
MALSVPPGHGKSYIAIKFSQWAYGQDVNNQIISVSYNEKQSTKFARGVRDGIMERSSSPTELTVYDIFPHVKIKRGDASVEAWSLEGRYMSYLATSFNATLTGNRGNIGIIDDPVKDHYEAFNEEALQTKYEWYNDTFLSRMVEGAIQIVIQTRWSTKDLIGRLLARFPDDWYELVLPACLNEKKEEMLCPELMSFERYMSLKNGDTSLPIFLANYQQECIDVQGRLYKNLKLYSDVPRDKHGDPAFDEIIAYIDTADQGNDYLCCIVAGVYKGELYILDVYYTKEGMEVTEPDTAKMLYRNKVNLAKFESNNGGRGFARNVERLLWETHKTKKVAVEWFHQSKKKITRIMVASTFVMEHVYFPEDWETRFKEFAAAILSFQREGKNKNDDAPDTLTGLVEMIGSQKASIKLFKGGL